MQSEAFKQIWGDFVDDCGRRRGGWDWYCTLTYRDRSDEEIKRGWTRVGMPYAWRTSREFLEVVGDLAGMRDQHWFQAAEFQGERGVPHWHMLIGNCRGARRDEAWRYWFENQGFARLLPYDERLGARYYLCKYVSKDLGEMYFSKNLRAGGG